MTLPAPIVREHEGVLVVRDDLLPGGTKARYLSVLFERFDEVVYASPAVGGAQLAIAYAARAAKKKATIFVARRAAPSARTLEARRMGARVFQVPHGYLSNVQAKARAYAADQGAHLLAFGGESEEALDLIAGAAADAWKIAGACDEVWSAAGSGVLQRGLQRGIARAGGASRFFAVQVGRALKPADAGIASIVPAPDGMAFEKEIIRWLPPFPSCRNYDAKAWVALLRAGRASAELRGNRRILFWNVLGPSPTKFSL